jgi:hypothetical protein
MTEETKLIEKTMIFKSGAEQTIWGIPLDTLEIDAHELDEYLADGWHKHPFDVRDAMNADAERDRLAKDAADASAAEQARLKQEADNAVAATNLLRDQLLAEADEMGLNVDRRWGAKTLQEAIDEAKKSE